MRLLRAILDDDVAKKGGRPRLKYHLQIMKDMRCGTLRVVTLDRFDGAWLRQTTFRSVDSMVILSIFKRTVSLLFQSLS